MTTRRRTIKSPKGKGSVSRATVRRAVRKVMHKHTLEKPSE